MTNWTKHVFRDEQQARERIALFAVIGSIVGFACVLIGFFIA